jgi:hypothetical protein
MPTGLDEAAAVAGLIGLSFQCLAGCIKGFQLISTALKVGKHADYYRVALLLEEQRLLSWSRCSGLSDKKLDSRLPWPIIKEALGQLSDLLCSVDTLSQRYKFKVETTHRSAALEDMSPYKGLGDDSFSFLLRGEIEQEREKIVERAKKIQHNVSVVKKFWFAAVDKDKFQELLRDIADLITKLRDLLSDRVQEEQQYQNVVLASKMNELKSIIEANSLRNLVHLPENSAALLKFILLSGNSNSGGEEVEHLLSLTAQSSHKSLQPIIQDRLQDRTTFGLQSLMGTITYDGTIYFFEIKKYDWPKSENERKKVQDAIVTLALLLNTPKHPSFQTLNCFGTLAEERSSQYLFLYQLPEESCRTAQPRTLLEYLSSSYKPSLTARIQLARELAHSLFQFQASNWMHKNFSSRNIIFFPRSSTSPRSLENPYIVGFAYSRPDEGDQPSFKLPQDFDMDIYYHPEYLEKASAFHKTYDIYGLGLILLEIAKWRPLKDLFIPIMRERDLEMTGKASENMSKEELHSLDKRLKEGFRKYSRKVKEALLDRSAKDNYHADVAFRAGDVFADVIFSCIGDDFDCFREEDDKVGLQNLFRQKILKPLDSIQG